MNNTVFSTAVGAMPYGRQNMQVYVMSHVLPAHWCRQEPKAIGCRVCVVQSPSSCASGVTSPNICSSLCLFALVVLLAGRTGEFRDDSVSPRCNSKFIS